MLLQESHSERKFPMELIQEIITATAAVPEADLTVLSGDVCASERRIEPRLPTTRLTALYLHGSGRPDRVFCTVLDVSQHGLKVRTTRPLTPGAQVRVTLREVSAVAKVCYSNPVKDGFDHGLQIQELEKH